MCVFLVIFYSGMAYQTKSLNGLYWISISLIQEYDTYILYSMNWIKTTIDPHTSQAKTSPSKCGNMSWSEDISTSNKLNNVLFVCFLCWHSETQSAVPANLSAPRCLTYRLYWQQCDQNVVICVRTDNLYKWFVKEI